MHVDIQYTCRVFYRITVNKIILIGPKINERSSEIKAMK